MKDIHFIGSSLKDLRALSDEIRQEVGFSLYLAQRGDKSANALPMLGFGSSKVLEVVVDSDGDTYRAVYTIKFAEALYVLHVFQKKSCKGIRTATPDVNLIKSRLKDAELHYDKHHIIPHRKERKHDRSG